VPFDRIEVAHYLPALDHAVAEAKARIDTILANPAAPDFENTIVALEQAGQDVDRVSSVFYNQLSARTSDELQALAADFGAKSANFSSDVSLDPRVFAKVRSVWEARDTLGLKGEQARLLDDTYSGFVRNGALLSDNEKGELRAIDEQLAKLTPDFQHNVLKATNGFTLWIEDEADLAGLPEGAVKAAKVAAQERERPDAWLITLDAPSYVPFMTYAEARPLREQLWRAFNARAFGGEFDNQPLIKEIATLRFRRARLLGYPTHAAFVIEKRMAETPAAVHAFLDRLLDASRPAAERDLADIQAHAKSVGGPEPVQPWDVALLSEKLKQHRFTFDEEALRPYFPLDRVIEGVFEHCRRLYGLVFRLSDAYPVWHPDVKAYEVYDEAEDRYVGLFYADFFPRSSKRNGAWMTTYRDQGLYADGVKRPHVAIVCNFTKPTGDRPSLLSYDEVRTFFHEMGHALHGLLSRCTYRSLGGTNVYWDFVELPSQIFENWAQEKDGLDLFARHYETGEPMPADLVQKIRDSARFMAGWQSLRQTAFSSAPAHLRDHLASRRRQDHADRKAAAVRRRHPARRRRSRPRASARNTRSDWMKIERERGISVVTSVMTFEYRGLRVQPARHAGPRGLFRGHLPHADRGRFRGDGDRRRQGHRGATRKLFEVCRLRDIPIITFINKMDRESRDPFDLLDEIEKTLALDTAPMTWPVGRGRDFLGTYDIAPAACACSKAAAPRPAPEQIDIADLAGRNANLDAARSRTN
jgi:peptidyl-dipeptidase Dcp